MFRCSFKNSFDFHVNWILLKCSTEQLFITLGKCLLSKQYNQMEFIKQNKKSSSIEVSSVHGGDVCFMK